MPLYKEKIFIAPLTWQNIFMSDADFYIKFLDLGWEIPSHEQLYDLLCEKYILSKTRYVNEISFLLALKREIDFAWIAYLQQKELFDTVKNLSIDEIMKQKESILSRNVEDEYEDTDDATITNDGSDNTLLNEVEANDDPIVNANTVAITNKSTKQINNLRYVDTDVKTDVKKEGTKHSNVEEQIIELGNKLDAINKKFEFLYKDLKQNIYKKTDKLFRQILVDDFDRAPYENEEA